MSFVLLFKILLFTANAIATAWLYLAMQRRSKILGKITYIPLISLGVYTALEIAIYQDFFNADPQWKIFVRVALLALCWSGILVQYNIVLHLEESALKYRDRALEKELQNAIATGELELHYQPIVDLQTEAIASYEALIRWNHPTEGLLSPSAFIPVAERSHLICDLFEWVLQQALEQAEKWEYQWSIAINFSPAQSNCLDDAAVGRLLNLAMAHKTSSITLEITEAAIATQQCHHVLEALSMLGFRLCLDDFGAEHSNYTRLINLPISKLKIDRAFIPQNSSGKSYAICKSVIELGHSLGLEVVAEGIETKAQAELLKALGCDYGQGWYYGKPKLPD